MAKSQGPTEEAFDKVYREWQRGRRRTLVVCALLLGLSATLFTVAELAL